MGECLGADIVVKNSPGAGGLLATNALAVADAEEPQLLITNTVGFAAAQIADAEGVQFDLAEMSWVGRVADATPAVTVGADSEISGFADIVDASEPVRFVATGPGGDDYIVPTVLSAAYGFPVNVITGFPGSGEARNALVAGDADAQSLSLTSQVSSVQSGEVRAILVMEEEPNELLPDAPPISEFPAPDEEAQEVVDSLVTLGASGRAIAAPPGLPEERLAELREGLDCALSNEALWRISGPIARSTRWGRRVRRGGGGPVGRLSRVRGGDQGVVLGRMPTRRPWRRSGRHPCPQDTDRQSDMRMRAPLHDRLISDGGFYS
ncbi:tripartite tricarboxylate transporter substrate-binding protein [Blastococcus brunescens]|uniref:Tripartite tricarboxylate transporter substrate-binding protein n=1 Tax=Blastococcus brunescens TaxID=1564165 RepID=A0ABZ1B8T5_9ACTN|nr:tripartite tricarboxylate transporter substrate-binding protein [Blastococcus sp. BMG 8361]WRL67205.1 tripartite tricarboxylate transporter substrate-binding protein [Blastococcus sp. BMG 8361]